MLAYFDQSALLTSDGHEDGDTLNVPALISRTGHYADKQITLTTADFDNAVREFAPVPLNYEHKRGPLDGHLGTLRSLWREGESLFGSVSFPKWLNHALRTGGERPKVSAEFDLRNKRLVGCAWTANPRIAEAGLLAAFSSASGPAGSAAFTQSKPSTIYFSGVTLHESDVKKLLAHWKIPASDAGYRDLEHTLKALEVTPSGKDIFNRITRGDKNK